VVRFQQFAWAVGLSGTLALGSSAVVAGTAAEQEDPLLLVDAEEISTSVIAVVEPDELRLALDGEEVLVALEDLRLPHKSSGLRETGRNLVARRLSGQLVRVRLHGAHTNDARGARRAVVYVEGRDLRMDLLEAGLAAYCPAGVAKAELLDLQDEAVSLHRGLWVDASSVADVCAAR